MEGGTKLYSGAVTKANPHSTDVALKEDRQAKTGVITALQIHLKLNHNQIYKASLSSTTMIRRGLFIKIGKITASGLRQE